MFRIPFHDKDCVLLYGSDIYYSDDLTDIIGCLSLLLEVYVSITETLLGLL